MKTFTLYHQLLVLFLIHVCSFSFAQEIQWQNTIGGITEDLLYSIHQTSDGGYILGGRSYSNISGDKTDSCIGVSDYWILKTDAVGNIQWQKTIGGTKEDDLYSIEQTSDGGFILGGFSYSGISGDKTESNFDPTMLTPDFWIVKTDSAGNIQWQNTIGGNDKDELYSIHQTADGGYILGGTSQSNISGDKTENLIGGLYNDYWILKTDSAGAIQWQNTIGGTAQDFFTTIQQTTDGGYVLGGYSFSGISGDKTEIRIGLYDYWIVKTDSIGNIQWQNTIGGSAEDWLMSIQQTTDDGYILGGFTNSNISGDKTENCTGGLDYWIVKTDAMGIIEWQNTIGGNGEDWFTSIEQTTDGGYILGGYSRSFISGDKTEYSHGLDDYWIVKTDSTGNIEWQNSIGGNSYDQLHSIHQTADGGYIVGGFSTSNISGDKTENRIGVGGSDYWIMKLTNKNNLITGKLFIDANSNGIQDVGETDVKNKMVTEINTTRFAFSEQNGHFSVAILDSGNFSVSPDMINYYNTIPTSQSAYFSSFHQTDSLNDFAFQPAGVFNDLCVQITPMNGFTAGFHTAYMITYENIGTTILSPSVIFFPDNDLTFVSASVTPTSVTQDSLVWNIDSLSPFESGNILVNLDVNITTSLGTLINSAVRIEPIVVDANPACNYDSSEAFVTGSMDPNAIVVDRDTVLTTELSSPPYLNYIIYFQNTGNDTAFKVKILNPIPTGKLKLSSFEFVASSHPVTIDYKVWERNMEFTFENIILPDSNVNEPESHGFVRYRIKPKSILSSGDSIKNNAFIYFDFNLPVKTNMAITKIITPHIYANINTTVCDSMLSPSGKYTWTISGIYSDTIVISAYLDSVFTVNLTVNHSSSASITEASCDSYISPSGNYTWNTSGTYMDTIQNAGGCDSIINVNLTVNAAYYTTDTITIIQGDSMYVGGGWQTTSGIYSDSLITQFGCDSIVTTFINVITSIQQLNVTSFISIKPNPANHLVSISVTFQNKSSAQVFITNLQGELILRDMLKSNQIKLIDVSTYSEGIYIVKVVYDRKIYYAKLVKK